MKTIILSLFKDSKKAGDAVAELKEKGYTKDISILTKDAYTAEEKSQTVKKDISEGAGTGSLIGAATGALAAILTGIPAVVVPGVGLLVGGPLVALLGLTGGAVGAVTGGLIGALVDLGLSDTDARLYEERVKMGEVMIGVSTDPEKDPEVRSILMKHDATDIHVVTERNP